MPAPREGDDGVSVEEERVGRGHEAGKVDHAEPGHDEIGERVERGSLGMIAVELDFAPLPDDVFWRHPHRWVGRIEHERVHPVLPPLGLPQRFVLHGARHVVCLGHGISHTPPPAVSRGLPCSLLA